MASRPPVPETAPVDLETDAAGNLTRLNGVELPEGLIHTAIADDVASNPPVPGTEWAVDAAYAHARRLRGEKV